MQEQGMRSVLRKKFIKTTKSNHSYTIYENLLQRNFEEKQIGKKWVSDITYIKYQNKWAYLTTIIDLADRKVVGWSLSKDMTTQNTIIKAWQIARSRRKISKNLIFHSDRGIQYASKQFSNILKFNKNIQQSMSNKGDCWDNAVAESFFKTIKYERLYRKQYKSFNQLYNDIYQYIEDWYNTKRIHSAIGYKTPLEKEIELINNLLKAA